jgi:RNA polymerase sigma factor (sigma-70 family)
LKCVWPVVHKKSKVAKLVRNVARPHEKESFETLVALMGQGSETAAWELAERYHKSILRIVRRHLPGDIRTKIDSVDIVQSVWKSFLRKESPLDHMRSAEAFIAYLAGMARLKVLETRRHFTLGGFDISREEHFSGVSAPTGHLADDPLHDRKSCEASAIIAAHEKWEGAMALVGERGREVVRLRLKGLTLEEIATSLGLSVMTVRRTFDVLLQSLTV